VPLNAVALSFASGRGAMAAQGWFKPAALLQRPSRRTAPPPPQEEAPERLRQSRVSAGGTAERVAASPGPPSPPLIPARPAGLGRALR